eukprot:gene6773-12766_t
MEEGEIILRVPTPNYRIPAYIGGNLAWGSPPKAAEDPTAAEGMSGAMQLPPGNTCQLSSDGTQVCGVSMTYCCGRPMSDDSPELATAIPSEWISLRQSSNSVNIPKDVEPPVIKEVNRSAPVDDSPAEPEDSGGKGGLPTGAVVGISVAAALLLLAILAACVVSRCAPSMDRKQRNTPSPLPLSCSQPKPLLQVCCFDEQQAVVTPQYPGPKVPVGQLLTEGQETWLLDLAPPPFPVVKFPTLPAVCGRSRLDLLPTLSSEERDSLISELSLRMDLQDGSNSHMLQLQMLSFGGNYASEVYTSEVLAENRFGGKSQNVQMQMLRRLTQSLAKEVELCGRFRNCARVVKLLAACLVPPEFRTAPIPASSNFRPATFDRSKEPSIPSEGGIEPGGPGTVVWDRSSLHRSQAMGGLGENIIRRAVAEPPDTLCYTASVRFAVPLVLYQLVLMPQVAVAAPKLAAIMALIMELVEGGSLSERIHSGARRRMDLLELLHVAYDIAQGLAYLHPHVIHRDLKPQNVLLDKRGRAKLADFGISRFKDPFKSFVSVTQQGGTPNYMAPEVFNGSHVDEKCDVYSLGCVMYECWTRRVPFHNLAVQAGPNVNVGLFQMLVQAGPNVSMGLFQIILAVAINGQRPFLPDEMPVGLRHLIIECWKEQPKQRPAIDTIIQRYDSYYSYHSEV